ncbi:hypothetical protein [Nocardia sp. SSK8]|uniref:hypothetical protein n=1 Tax=Nocardia sp. SSK8 TaxID=3120154 RepID=UPI0030084351
MPFVRCGATGLPDIADRHVVAAAVRGNAEAIVTDNLKHFPVDALARWGLHAISSDDFLLDVFDLSPSVMLSSLIEMAGRRRNPPVTVPEIVVALGAANASRFAREIEAVLVEGM